MTWRSCRGSRERVSPAWASWGRGRGLGAAAAGRGRLVVQAARGGLPVRPVFGRGRIHHAFGAGARSARRLAPDAALLRPREVEKAPVTRLLRGIAAGTGGGRHAPV